MDNVVNVEDLVDDTLPTKEVVIGSYYALVGVAEHLWKSVGRRYVPVYPQTIASDLRIRIVTSSMRYLFGLAFCRGHDVKIILRARDPSWAQRFVCAHEIAHILFESPDWPLHAALAGTRSTGARYAQIESLCDAFSLCLVIPLDLEGGRRSDRYDPVKLSEAHQVPLSLVELRLELHKAAGLLDRGAPTRQANVAPDEDGNSQGALAMSRSQLIKVYFDPRL